MSKSRRYRAQDVQSVDVSKWVAGHEGQAAVVGVDVGEESLFMVVRWASEDVTCPVRAQQPEQLGLAMAFLKGVGTGREMKVALEPTGTYGDPFRYACARGGLRVERVSPVASNRHAEVYDGVPSQHDGKDAAVVAELAAMGKSKPWPWDEGTELEQELAVHADLMDGYQREYTAWRNRLHAKLARHWPEVLGLLKMESVTLLGSLIHYGSPAALAADAEAGARLARWGGPWLKPETIRAVVDSAGRSCGVPLTGADSLIVVEIAQRVLESKRRLEAHHKKVRECGGALPEVTLMGEALGKATMAILHVEVGDPSGYPSVRAYQRALGLNLKVHASGKYTGRLKITHRGSSRGRRWLYLAVMRLLAEPGVGAWYQRKVARDGGKKGKAMTAVMRKVAGGIHHCRRTGEAFDPERLFQTPTGRGKPRRAGGSSGSEAGVDGRALALES